MKLRKQKRRTIAAMRDTTALVRVGEPVCQSVRTGGPMTFSLNGFKPGGHHNIRAIEDLGSGIMTMWVTEASKLDPKKNWSSPP